MVHTQPYKTSQGSASLRSLITLIDGQCIAHTFTTMRQKWGPNSTGLPMLDEEILIMRDEMEAIFEAMKIENSVRLETDMGTQQYLTAHAR